MSTPCDPLHRAYFNGEALWTYLTTLLSRDSSPSPIAGVNLPQEAPRAFAEAVIELMNPG